MPATEEATAEVDAEGKRVWKPTFELIPAELQTAALPLFRAPHKSGQGRHRVDSIAAEIMRMKYAWDITQGEMTEPEAEQAAASFHGLSVAVSKAVLSRTGVYAAGHADSLKQESRKKK